MIISDQIIIIALNLYRKEYKEQLLQLIEFS